MRIASFLALFVTLGCSGKDGEGSGGPAVGTPAGTEVGTPAGTSAGTPAGTASGTPGTTQGASPAFELDLAGGTWLEPAGLGPVVGSAMMDVPALLGVVSSGATLDLRAAVTDGAVQDRCLPTTDSLGNDFSAAPVFTAPFAAVPVVAQGLAVPIQDVTFQGSLDPAAPSLGQLQMSGRLDVAALTTLIGSDPCALLATFGVVCSACPSGAVSCVNVLVTDIPATVHAGVVYERTSADVTADPLCP